MSDSVRKNEYLPKGWGWTTLDAITTNHDGTRIPIKSDDRKSRQGAYPYYGASGIIDTIDDYLFDGTFLLIGEDGANLITRSTPIAFQARGQFWVNNHAHVLQTCGGIPLEFVEGFISSIDLQPYVTGSAQPKLTQRNLNRIRIQLPPLTEQKRIVAKVEVLLERVNQASERLDRVPDLLKRFRQSVLTTACSGQLTADWREENPKSKSEAKPPLNSNEYDAELLGELPETWCWAEIEEVGNVKSGKRLPKGEKLVDYVTPFPYIVAGQLKNGTVIEKNQKYLTPEIQKKIKRYTINVGDVYITIVGACIGDAGVVPLQKDGANLTENAAKITNFDGILSGYLSVWLRSLVAQQVINQMIMSGSQGKLALKRIKVIPVPLPSIAEQEEIVQRIDALFEIANKIEQRISIGTNQTEKITQSILDKAFVGELVETEADLAHREGRDYEPASVLLERIAAGRAAGNGKPKKKSRKKAVRK